jgi:zinc finger FYVE domain-containing protein 1
MALATTASSIIPTSCAARIIDEEERLIHRNLSQEEELLHHLGCEASSTVKVLAIFGNTGDGKSHALNHAVFEGMEVFRTSDRQESCTMGVWLAFSKELDLWCIDTEGLLGSTANAQKRARLLLKILGVSDIIIYLSRAERLHTDLFDFLQFGSDSFLQYFAADLEHTAARFNLPVAHIGPSVIVFHQTVHTRPLESAELLRARFRDHAFPKAYSGVAYIGTQQVPGLPTDFQVLRQAIYQQQHGGSLRVARPCSIVMRQLRLINDKFSGAMDQDSPSVFLDQCFQCGACCGSCGMRCSREANHKGPHEVCKPGSSAHTHCVLSAALANVDHYCQQCYNNGRETRVEPAVCSPTESSSYTGMMAAGLSFLLAGAVYDCKYCGVIHRSRGQWVSSEANDQLDAVPFVGTYTHIYIYIYFFPPLLNQITVLVR